VPRAPVWVGMKPDSPHLRRGFGLGGLASGLAYLLAHLAYEDHVEADSIRWVAERMQVGVTELPRLPFEWNAILSRFLVAPVSPLLFVVTWLLLRSDPRARPLLAASHARTVLASILLFVSHPAALLGAVAILQVAQPSIDPFGAVALVCSFLGGALLSVCAALVLPSVSARAVVSTLGASSFLGAIPIVASAASGPSSASARAAVLLAGVWPGLMGWMVGRWMDGALGSAAPPDNRAAPR
jgi:hypothetical protein